ncbi:MAG: hypothetical protein WDA74_00795 [Spirochaetota bacterium]
MISLIKTVIRIIFLSAIVYAVLFTFYVLDDNKVGVVKDIANNQVVHLFSSTYNFVWYGFTPWLYKVEKVPVKYNTSIEVRVPLLSGKADLEGSLDIRIPLEVSYRIDRDIMPGFSFFENSSKNGYLVNIGTNVCSSLFHKYIEPDYRRRDIERNEEMLLDSIKTGMKFQLGEAGIIVDSINSSGAFILPSFALYREAMLKEREMKEIAFRNQIQEIHLKNNLNKEKIAVEAYYEKLSRVGEIIKKNPDILKYIYIDKLAGNIKVIMPSDKNPMSEIFGSDQEVKDSDLKKDIDNFR